ncbi:carbohydrate ABC transporter permease [Spartinivicinus ruber]|uniref:carbohydrate ABC transporter permease n=1 Tax=Spartinivicinus ruber TaxID=2683272 RepID=UPI0013D59C36|nr:sugar ABC transporter permease [Spartinivicinus ruber]
MFISQLNKRWHIPFFITPALVIYSLFMIYPLIESLKLSFFQVDGQEQIQFVGFANYLQLFFDASWSEQFWNAFANNGYFFLIHMLVQNPIGLLIAALLSIRWLPGRSFYRTAIFLPALLSFVLVGFIWKLVLSPLWGVSENVMSVFGLENWFAPWLGLESTALTTIALVSVWQFVGIPMMLIYAALLSIPDEIVEAARCDGLSAWTIFWKIKLPLILPTLGIVTILTFVGNFNAFDLIYVSQGALAGPDFSTDILGTFLYRTFFGHQLQLGNPAMGAAIASVMFFIILCGVCLYLFFVQRKLTRYEL